jgi:hypothetical protein
MEGRKGGRSRQLNKEASRRWKEKASRKSLKCAKCPKCCLSAVTDSSCPSNFCLMSISAQSCQALESSFLHFLPSARMVPREAYLAVANPCFFASLLACGLRPLRSLLPLAISIPQIRRPTQANNTTEEEDNRKDRDSSNYIPMSFQTHQFYSILENINMNINQLTRLDT